VNGSIFVRRKILLGVGALCLVLAAAFGVFAAILYQDNNYERRLHDEYFRGGYPSSESKMTAANWAFVGLSVMSGATGILCLARAGKAKAPPL
jgi:hypothetical protein